MKRKFIGILLALVLLVSLSLVTASPAMAATYSVPGDFATIQAAVTAAGPDDTINVAAGTYNENVVVPVGKDGLQIIGNSNTDTFITVGNGIGFQCSCPITIKRFDISGTARGSGHAFKLMAGSAGTAAKPGVFEDNIVHSLNYGMTTGDYTPRPEYWEIKNNQFSDLRIGLLLEHCYHFLISGNSLEDYKEGVTMGYDCDTARYIDITDNEFLGTTDAELGAAIVISSQAQEIHVLRNEIRDSLIGVLIKVSNLSCPELVNVNINRNNIVGNGPGQGVKNESSTTDVDAACNWWGADDGPGPVGLGSGDTVTQKVSFHPWLIAPAPGGRCFGGMITVGNDAYPVNKVSILTPFLSMMALAIAVTGWFTLRRRLKAR